ncbi:MAG: DNA gyrase inhibitor YacG [Nitrospirae bacterium]|nr:DNA gyrase inhibitor YacG [Nitrospirota bacterium]
MRAKVVRCPACTAEAPWEPNPWRPFCSERCRLTDLGAWAAEWYRVPGQSLTTPAAFQDSDDDSAEPSAR